MGDLTIRFLQHKNNSLIRKCSGINVASRTNSPLTQNFRIKIDRSFNSWKNTVGRTISPINDLIRSADKKFAKNKIFSTTILLLHFYAESIYFCRQQKVFILVDISVILVQRRIIILIILIFVLAFNNKRPTIIGAHMQKCFWQMDLRSQGKAWMQVTTLPSPPCVELLNMKLVSRGTSLFLVCVRF